MSALAGSLFDAFDEIAADDGTLHGEWTSIRDRLFERDGESVRFKRIRVTGEVAGLSFGQEVPVFVTGPGRSLGPVLAALLLRLVAIEEGHQ